MIAGNHTTPTTTNKAIEHLEQAIADGRQWYIALLESIRLWTVEEETHNGRHYRYLIDGEAFDWLLLAERLCLAVDGLLPQGEKMDLLFERHPPLDIADEEFERLMGPVKYQQHLNYFYGVIVEDALILAVTKEVRKERQILGANGEDNIDDEAFQRIYALNHSKLLKRFRQEKDYHQTNFINLEEQKEFTYWLFKCRLASNDKARVASDTKKALNCLNDTARTTKQYF